MTFSPIRGTLGFHHRAHIDRTTAASTQPLVALYPRLSGLVILPTFRVANVLSTSMNGTLMPPGCTRFTISPRVLHADYPFAERMGGKSTTQKNDDLHRWLLDRCAQRGFRFYAESTIFFDE